MHLGKSDPVFLGSGWILALVFDEQLAYVKLSFQVPDPVKRCITHLEADDILETFISVDRGQRLVFYLLTEKADFFAHSDISRLYTVKKIHISSTVKTAPEKQEKILYSTLI